MTAARRSVIAATVTLSLAVAWLALTVHFNDSDNWTALYYTGAQSAIPPQLGDEDVFQFKGSPGYDGQYYHYIAHDPFFQRGMERYVDNPHLRYRRILVPALAYLLVFGNEDYVDSAYLAVMLAFLWFGAFALGRYAVLHERSPWWGIAFLAVPAVLVSLDRMTVDLALAALAIAFIWSAEASHPALFYSILVAAPLVRETGVLFIVAACIWRWRDSWKFLLCAIPFGAWELFLRARFGQDQTVLTTFVPFSALVVRTLHPVQFAWGSRWLAIASILDSIALAGIWLALLCCVWLLWKRAFGLLEISAILFAAFTAILGSPLIWSDTFAFGRTFTPLLVWLALLAIARGWLWMAAPLAATLPRILFQFEPQVKRILQG